jgi:hypothetical protein
MHRERKQMNDIERLEAQMAQLESRKAQLDARLKAARQKDDAEEKKARQRATFVLGELVLEVLGDWKDVDFSETRAYMARHADKMRAQCRTAGHLTRTEALAALRDWDRAGRPLPSDGNEA